MGQGPFVLWNKGSIFSSRRVYRHVLSKYYHHLTCLRQDYCTQNFAIKTRPLHQGVIKFIQKQFILDINGRFIGTLASLDGSLANTIYSEGCLFVSSTWPTLSLKSIRFPVQQLDLVGAHGTWQSLIRAKQ